jgi:hypothetical protein
MATYTRWDVKTGLPTVTSWKVSDGPVTVSQTLVASNLARTAQARGFRLTNRTLK